jgi:hypothetical protein
MPEAKYQYMEALESKHARGAKSVEVPSHEFGWGGGGLGARADTM